MPVIGGFLMVYATFSLFSREARLKHVLMGVLGFWLVLAAVFL